MDSLKGFRTPQIMDQELTNDVKNYMTVIGDQNIKNNIISLGNVINRTIYILLYLIYNNYNNIKGSAYYRTSIRRFTEHANYATVNSRETKLLIDTRKLLIEYGIKQGLHLLLD